MSLPPDLAWQGICTERRIEYSGLLRFADVGISWREHERNQQQEYEEAFVQANIAKGPLSRTFGFQAGSVMPEVMRDDLQGIRQHAIGSILAFCCKGNFFHWKAQLSIGGWKSKVDWQLFLANQDFCAWCKGEKATIFVRGWNCQELHVKSMALFAWPNQSLCSICDDPLLA